MGLQLRLLMLLGLMFAILYGVIVVVGSLIGQGSLIVYVVIAVVMVGIQYLIGPSMVGWAMKVKWVSEQEQPDLHRMVAELAQSAGLRKPKVGVSQLNIPNAFAYGRTQGDARICVTEPLLRSMNRDEVKAVLGHEMSHIKHRDMALLTLLSILPMIIYYIATSLMWSGMFGGGNRNREGGASPLPLIGIGLLVLYFFVNLLVLYASRIREYYADMGSVRLGSEPRHLANALYKLVLGSARASKETLRSTEGVKAFFVNDPGHALNEIRDLKEIDANLSGAIDQTELLTLRDKKIRLGLGEKMIELFTTHPNMLKRIKHLSTLGEAGPYIVAR